MPERYRSLIASLNRTEAAIPESTLHGLIEEQIRRTPDSEALTYEGRSLSYAAFVPEPQLRHAGGAARHHEGRGRLPAHWG